MSKLLQLTSILLLSSRALSIIVTDPPPTTEYNYWYHIIDPSTGDAKGQQEVRHGDTVKGFYTVLDPDGTKRTVDYLADSRNGFKAFVRSVPIGTDSRTPSEGKQYSAPLQVYQRSNDRLSDPVLFTPGNDTRVDRPTFGRGVLFMPNYMRY
ncbi:unnamed protein product [Leptosia nina]|uniref:Uncharacterized protein n=1 Tax=Leptosia nina TaxID=320188 RepID=A0AAV1JAN9_9NEOP